MGKRGRLSGVAVAAAVAVAVAPAPAHAIGWLNAALPAGGASEHGTVGMAANGELIAAWNRTIDGAERIQAAIRAPGGQYTVPQTIGGDDAIGADHPQLAVAPDGTAVLVWTRPDATESLHYSVRAPGGSFAPAQSLTDSGVSAVFTPRVVINAKGDALAFWQRNDSQGTLRVFASVRPAGGGFSDPVAVSPGEGCEPSGAIGDDGTAAVAFVVDCNGLSPTVGAALRQPGGSFVASPPLAPASDQPSDTAVAVSPNGAASFAWTATGGGTSVVKASTSEGPQQISPEGQVADGPVLLAAPDSATYAAFATRATGEQARIAVAKRAVRVLNFAPSAFVSDPAAAASDPVLRAMNDSSVLLVLAPRRRAGKCLARRRHPVRPGVQAVAGRSRRAGLGGRRQRQRRRRVRAQRGRCRPDSRAGLRRRGAEAGNGRRSSAAPSAACR